MNTSSAPQPERPSASDGNRSADDEVPLALDQSEATLRPSDLTGGPDRQKGPAQAGDEEDDGYEPL